MRTVPGSTARPIYWLRCGIQSFFSATGFLYLCCTLGFFARVNWGLVLILTGVNLGCLWRIHQKPD